MGKNENVVKAVLWVIIVGLLVTMVYLEIFFHPEVSKVLAPVTNGAKNGIRSLTSEISELTASSLTDPTTVLFMGTDVVYSGQRGHVRPEKGALNGNSDTMMLAFLDPPHNTVSVLNIPRDTEAYVGDAGIQKINSANARGGPKLATATVTGLLNVPIDHYVVMNVHALVDLVNEVGGITVEVPKKMSYMDWTAKLKIDLDPGFHTLTGNQAMGFVRFRHDALGDIGRVQRQQLFLQAVSRKMTEPASWLHVPQLLKIAQDNMETDLSPVDLLRVLNFAHSVPKSDVKFVMLPGQFAPNGDWIAYTDGREIASKMAHPELDVAASRKNITVSVINATDDPAMGTKVAQALHKIGYIVSVGKNEGDVSKATKIIAQKGNTADAKMVQQDLGGVGSVVNASVGNLLSSITIIVHPDLDATKIHMSSVDAPYVASTGASQPIVVKTFEVNAGGQARKRSSLKADDSSLSPTEPVVPSGEIVDPTSLDTTEHLVPESKDALPAEQYVPQVAPSDDALLHSSVTAPAPGTSSQIPTPTSSKQQPETSRVGEPSAKSAVSRNSETEKIEKEAEPEPEQKTEDDKVKKIPTD